MKNYLLFVFTVVQPFLGNLILAQESVTIPDVGTITGKIEELPHFGVEMASFYGIPYAQQPLRFAPITSWPRTLGNFSADEKIACIQRDSTMVPAAMQREDCLVLNIFKRAGSRPHPVPVLVAIHGGSFIWWHGAMLSGHRLLEHDIVLVSINYRLNVFGFFTLESDQAPGNLGLLDQITAIKWVQKYISNFGGDPNLITIYGGSAGGSSVGLLTDYVDPIDEPFKLNFHRSIGASGDNLAGWTLNKNAFYESKQFTQRLHCNQSDESELLACLRTRTTSQIYDGIGANFYSAPSIQSRAKISPKYIVVPDDPSNVLPKNRRQVPYLLGSNLHDGSFLLSRYLKTALKPKKAHLDGTYLQNEFVQRLLQSVHFGEMKDTPVGSIDSLITLYLGDSRWSQNFTQIAPHVVDLYSAFYFKIPTLLKAKSVATTSTPSYLYSFDYHTERRTFYEEMGGDHLVPKGVTHTDELHFLFDFGAEYGGEFTKEEHNVSRILCGIFYNFMLSGNPNGDGEQNALLGHDVPPHWPKVDHLNDAYWSLTSQAKLVPHYAMGYHPAQNQAKPVKYENKRGLVSQMHDKTSRCDNSTATHSWMTCDKISER